MAFAKVRCARGRTVDADSELKHRAVRGYEDTDALYEGEEVMRRVQRAMDAIAASRSRN